MVLREVDSKELAMALKGASPSVKDRFVSNMSDRVASMLKEDIEFMGPLRMSDVEDVQLRIVQTVRQLEDAGQVTVVRGDTNDVFV